MVYYGEKKCQAKYKSGDPCKNWAYYEQSNKILCGQHSDKSERKKLKKDPNAAKKRLELYQERQKLVEKIAKANQKKGEKGDVICSKLRMMKQPEHFDGYLKIFPNYKHQNRKDGLGMKSLSPKDIGPINHQMPGLPVAKNLENYHQFAKVFPWEVDSNDKIKESSIKHRIKGYQDEEPHRHKFSREEILKYSDNVNIPLFSVYYDQEGQEHRYSYLECRYFYCYWYEKLVKDLPDYNKLKKLRDRGYNLQIVGYDGYHVEQDLWQCYLDTSRPFGHELVLYTMLVEEDSKKYPWNRYYKENLDIYHFWKKRCQQRCNEKRQIFTTNKLVIKI